VRNAVDDHFAQRFVRQLGTHEPHRLVNDVEQLTAEVLPVQRIDGAGPTGVSGPYNSLLSSTWAGAYADEGTGCTGTFRQDAGAPYSPAIEFDSPTPEPASLALVGAGLIGLGFLRRRIHR
jgi:hypothetical protein